jgi:hypothetical protein
MSGTSFFSLFPKVPYQFGDGSSFVNYQNLSVYIDAFDQVREYKTFYQKYFIKENQRPDQLSLEIYGTTDYYWTFFLMNEHLRTNGWPMPSSRVYSRAQKYYPNIVYTTDGTSFDISRGDLTPLSRSGTFAVGGWVYLSTVKKAAQILRINDDLAQIFLDIQSLPPNESVLRTISEQDAYAVNNVDPDYFPTFLDTTTVQRGYNQWDAIHHYEDEEGNWVTPTTASTEPYEFQWNSVNTAQSVSYFQRMRDLNLENRAINVLKPEAVNRVVADFKHLLKKR